MRISILTLFPEIIAGVLACSITGRAVNSGQIELDVLNIRDYADNKHKQADDYPFGGGSGMVLMPQPAFDCIEAAESMHSGPYKRVYMSPRGKTLDADMAAGLAKEGLIIFCGHYEGIDQRIIDNKIDMEISIGDYILTGGELPAMVLADSVIRHVPGVLSSDVHRYESFSKDSEGRRLLEYPQYTRPSDFRGLKVPDILLCGHHANIQSWRQEKALELTKLVRPDLLD